MTEREFQTIIDKLDNLDHNNQLLSEKIELYRQVGEAQITSIRSEISAFQEANKQQIEASQKQIETNQKQIEAFQEANKQQIEATQKQIETNQKQIEAFQEANKQQIESFQEANKQQLNVSLGVLVTAAAAILASVVLGMAN